MDKYDVLKLENQLCFPLYAIAKEITRAYQPYLEPLNLTYTQYITMMVLWEHKEISVKELGNSLYLDSGTLTPLLKKMEQKSWIRRIRSKEDERSVLIQLTGQGEALKEEAVKVPAAVSACVNINSEEAKQLYHILHHLLQSSWVHKK